jgi:hypothetical protein
LLYTKKVSKAKELPRQLLLVAATGRFHLHLQ